MRARRTSAALAVLATMLVAAACGGDDKKSTSTTTRANHGTSAPRTTTTAPPPAVDPLTGAPGDATPIDGVPGLAVRPALTVKVENLRTSHPQSGIEQADVVYEEVVECSITRLAAVFHSHMPATIGPIRSVRRTDQALVKPVRGIFVYSGGAPYAEQSIAAAPVVRFNETSAGDAMFRDHARKAPGNLYLRPERLFAKAAKADGPPDALFQYGAAPVAGAVAGAHAVVGFHNGYAVTWDYDAAKGVYRRSIFGRPDTSASGVAVTAANVVVQTVRYVDAFGGANGCGDIGARADMASGGEAWVLRGGRAVHGTWQHTDPAGPYTFRAADGSAVTLTPGTTWVELPKPGYATTVS